MRRPSARRPGAGHSVTLIVHRSELGRALGELEPGVPAAMVPTVLKRLRDDGFLDAIHVVSEPTPPLSHVAILHVDSTRVPAEYARIGAAYPRCLNGRVLDISKRAISTSVADESWDGPVIVKSDLNCNGRPELALNSIARSHGQPEPFPEAREVTDYRVFDDLAAVPPELLADPALVVERFLPEREGDAYAIRHWLFCGERGYCNRYVSPERVAKGDNVLRKDPVPVPRQLRRWRRRHGLDIGKLDFVVHGGRPVLLDANKTPGPFPTGVPGVEDRVRTLAAGMARLIGTAR